MAIFEMVKYHNQSYPESISLRIEECAAHFDAKPVVPNLLCSFHTEYSYGKRKFDSAAISSFAEIKAAHKDGVPQLWKNEKWSAEFAEFLISFADSAVPAVIEIHPPFSDYTDFKNFIDSYKVFEQRILEAYPEVCILIENRCGSVYKGGRFLLSKTSELETLCDFIEKENLRLKIAYDVPQIYTAHNVKKSGQYTELLANAREFRQHIGGVHLWGKRKSASGRKVSHCGDLTSYFEGDLTVKQEFLQQFELTFNDGICRKMVLEVNSGNEDLLSIVNDLQASGVEFI